MDPDEVNQLRKDKAYALEIQRDGQHYLPGGQSRLLVSRPFDQRGQKVNYQIIINGHDVGEVPHKNTTVFTVPSGDCVVFVKFKTAKSNIIGFKIQPGQTIQLRVCWTFSSLMINRVGEKEPAQNPNISHQSSSVSPAPAPQLWDTNPSKLDQAFSLARNGRKQEAIPILKEVLKAEPDNEKAWLCLCFCLDRNEQKKYCLRQALRINPANSKARQALDQLSSSSPVGPQNNAVDTGAKSCAHCGKPLSFEATFCPSCGYPTRVDSLVYGAPQVQPTRTEPEMSTWGPETHVPSTIIARPAPVLRCPVCRSENPPHANLCAYCGYNFNPQPGHTATPAYQDSSKPESESGRFRFHFVDLGPLVIVISLFLPWATIYQNTFIGNRMNYYDFFGIINQFDGYSGVNISAMIYLLLGLGAWVLVRARLKPLAVLAALGAVAAQIYTLVSINQVSGVPSGSDGWFFDLATVSLREGVIVGLVGVVIVLIGTLFYRTHSSQLSRKLLKILGILLLIIIVLVSCGVAGYFINSRYQSLAYQKEYSLSATASAKATSVAKGQQAAHKATERAVSQEKTAAAVAQTASVMQGDPWGHQVVYVSGGGTNDDLYVATLNGYRTRSVTQDKFAKMLVRWSPDGTALAYGGQTMSHSTYIYLVDASGKNLRDVAYVHKANFSWSADSKSLYYVTSMYGRSKLRQVRLEDEKDTEVLETRYELNSIAASPDGKTIAFSSRCPSDVKHCIYLLDLNTQEVEQVHFSNTNKEFEVIHNLDWSPDSQRLVFQSGYSEEGHIYIVNRDGGELARLSDRPGFSPSWCYDGKWIIFAASTEPEQIIAVRSDGSQEVDSQIITKIYNSLACEKFK